MGTFFEVRASEAIEVTPNDARVAGFRAKHLEVAMMDVGEGQAILVSSPSRQRTMLVDGGSGRKSTVLAKALATAIPNGSLAAFHATHPHVDHLGGIASLVRDHEYLLRKPTTFYESGVPALNKKKQIAPWWQDLVEALADRKVKRRTVQRLLRDRRSLGEGIALAFYAAPFDKDPPYQSVFCHLTYGDARFLFTGDAHCTYERKLLDRYERRGVFRAEALNVTHHGGQNGTSRRLAKAVAPGIAFASTYDERGHHWEDVARERVKWAVPYETWRDGDVILRTDGKADGGGVLFEVETRMPGKLAPVLGLKGPEMRVPYVGSAPTGDDYVDACEEMTA